MTSPLPINTFKPGDQMKITSIALKDVMRRRLLDLGFVPGAVIKMVDKSPLGDPVAFQVSHTKIALRTEESSLIFAELLDGEDDEQ
ncbi:ferrous iron transport protein A [Halobacillus salinarum]|uniref:Ferrous iron transport protein A n=1 Tax=Halobacillus salinarum TaxID=2932257 RepID=A0ABY4EK22_9BACI|nr:FeoA family protein [Halobacillus salinarum]UOQ44524.1 ferrous iron transport protein A [Halobacillus salinarum]